MSGISYTRPIGIIGVFLGLCVLYILLYESSVIIQSVSDIGRYGEEREHAILETTVAKFKAMTDVKSRSLYRKMCASSTLYDDDLDFQSAWTRWEDVLLIIVFNNPLYEVIPLIEILYRPFFPQILYCGPVALNMTQYPTLEGYEVSFISYGLSHGHEQGSFFYKCLMKAVQMSYNVSGYLTIPDDAILKPRQMLTLNQSKAWFQKETLKFMNMKTMTCPSYGCGWRPTWLYWSMYQNRTIQALTDLQNAQKSSELMHTCYQTLIAGTGGEFIAIGAFADIYYLPNAYARDFAEICNVFLAHHVFVEITIPTVLFCLIPQEEFEFILGTVYELKWREEPWRRYHSKNFSQYVFFHPTKWSSVLHGNSIHKQFFCEVVSGFHREP